jgi:O-antigen ligase
MVKFLKRWWLPALLVCLPFERIPSLGVAVGSHTATLHLSMLIAGIGIVLFGPALARKIRLSITSPYFWLAAYIVVMLLSAITSIDKPKSLIVIIATTLTIAGGVIVGQIVRREDLSLIQRLILGVTVVVSLFGIYQFIGDSLGLSIHLTGLRPNYTKHVFGFPRIQSTQLEPLFFANYLLLPILLAASLLYTKLQRNWLAYLRFLLFIVVLALTLSRGGIYGGLAGLVVAGVLLWRAGSIGSGAAVIGTVVVGTGVAIGSIYLVTGVHSTPTQSRKAVSHYVVQSTSLSAATSLGDSDRVTDLHLAKRAFKARPLLGYGIGSFGTYAERELPAMYPAKGNSPTVNNEYYEVLAETGLLGAVALIGFLLTLLARIYTVWKQPLSPLHRTWLAALIGTGIAYGIQYYAFSTLYIAHIWVTVGLMLALTVPPAATTPKKSSRAKAGAKT